MSGLDDGACGRCKGDCSQDSSSPIKLAEAAVGIALDRTCGHDAGDEHDRDVEEEHPPPTKALHQQAAQQRASRQRDAADTGPDPDRPGLLTALRERTTDDRQRAGQQQCGPDALYGAGDDQHPHRRG